MLKLQPGSKVFSAVGQPRPLGAVVLTSLRDPRI